MPNLLSPSTSLPPRFISAVLPPSSLSLVTHPFITESQRYTTVLHNHTGLALKNKRICILISISFGYPPTPFCFETYDFFSSRFEMTERTFCWVTVETQPVIRDLVIFQIHQRYHIRWNFCTFLWEETKTGYLLEMKLLFKFKWQEKISANSNVCNFLRWKEQCQTWMFS